MNKLIKTLFFIGLIFSAINLFGQGYEIKVKVKGLKVGDNLILGHQLNTKLVPDDTAKVQQDNYAVFKKPEKLVGGMYFIYLSTTGVYFNFILDKDQLFTLESDTTDLVANFKSSGSLENEVFGKYQNFRIPHLKESHKLNLEKKEKSDNKKRVKQIDKKLNQINQEIIEYNNKIIEKYPDLFFTTFLKSNNDVIIPDEVSSKSDSVKYVYYKQHYFDNFDITDQRLLRTPIYEAKIIRYFDNVVMQNPDSINYEIDLMLNKVQQNPEIFRFMLLTLFNKYARSKFMTAENIYVHIAEKWYIPYAEWSDRKFIEELKTKVYKKKFCLFGKEAMNLELFKLFNDSVKINQLLDKLPNLIEQGMKLENDSSRSFENKKNDYSILLSNHIKHYEAEINTNSIKTKYKIMWFWEPECSHCKKATPKFHQYYVENKLKDLGVEVIAVYMHKGIDDWKHFTNSVKDWMNFVKKNQINQFTNVWSPFEIFRTYYDLESTPVLYLLDEDNKIIAKRIGWEQACEIIENIETDKKK